MNKLCRKFYGLLVLVTLVAGTAHGQDEFDRIEERILSYLKTHLDTAAKNHVLSLNADGSWSDIDYSSKAETSWSPLQHLNRVRQIALKSKSGQDPKITSALRYWLQANPRSNNWFQNEIASPTAIGEILMLLKDNKVVPIALRDSLIVRMKQGDVVRAIGANKLDIAIHMMYRACLTRDKILMDSAVNQSFMPITLSNKEGLQPDFSYRQHGPQLQIASYGQVFLMGEYKVASWLIGTSYALPADKLEILDHYLINTYLKTIRGRYIDFNTEGRGISRNDILDKQNITSKAGAHSLLALAKLVNPNNAAVLYEAEQRILQKESPSFNIKPGHAYFYKSDYTLHNRPNYFFNVRMVSKRTIRTEFGNKENLLGKFLPDGSTTIQRRGDEYHNIMPVWEWDKIPGITSRDYLVDQKTTLEWGERGVGAFIGGVSDGLFGTTVYDLNYNEVTAKKSWFFFDEEVVCLGAGINSYANEPITTTLNQAWLRGEVKAFVNDKLIDANKGFKASNVDWVLHDSIGYYFPNRGLVHLTNAEETGSWAKVNANRSKNEVKGRVFKLWFNHGIDPENQSYAYIVKPGIGEKEMSTSGVNSIKIISNTTKVQAVENTDLQMVQAVFYEAGTLKQQGYTISVDRPCVVLVKAINSKNPILSVSDPTQQLTDLRVSVNGVSASITLPQGDHKGATVSYTYSKF